MKEKLVLLYFFLICCYRYSAADALLTVIKFMMVFPMYNTTFFLILFLERMHIDRAMYVYDRNRIQKSKNSDESKI